MLGRALDTRVSGFGQNYSLSDNKFAVGAGERPPIGWDGELSGNGLAGSLAVIPRSMACNDLPASENANGSSQPDLEEPPAASPTCFRGGREN
jgi:hypothetical protein